MPDKNNEELQKEFQKRFDKWTKGECEGNPSCCKGCTNDQEVETPEKKRIEIEAESSKDFKIIIPLIKIPLDKIKEWFKKG